MNECFFLEKIHLSTFQMKLFDYQESCTIDAFVIQKKPADLDQSGFFYSAEDSKTYTKAKLRLANWPEHDKKAAL